MRILVTGARGMLGRALCPLLGARHEVVPVDIEDFDISDGPVTIRRVEAAEAELVIHAAAMTQVDLCQTEWEKAYRVNALGTRNVALGAGRSESAVLYLSTDFVFDGRKGEAYLEFDRPQPLSVYGSSKLAGEEFIRALVRRHYVVRTSWLFGPGGANFVDTVLKKAEAGERLRVVADQVGSPTYAPDLAAGLVELVESGLYGTYHVTNAGSCSWYEYACTILRLAGREKTEVRRLSSHEWGAPAPRPAHSVLRGFAWSESGFTPLRSWEEALEDYLRERRSSGGAVSPGRGAGGERA